MKTPSAQLVAASLMSSLSLRLSHFSLQTLQELLKSEASGEECAQERVYDLGFTIKKAEP